MRGSVAIESTVPRVNISEAKREFLPYLMHCRVQSAAGGADAATITVSRTFSSILPNNAERITARAAGKSRSFRKQT